MDERNTYIHDAYISMAERTIKRQWITIILLILLLVASNLAWLNYESSFADEETTTVTQELDTKGGGNAIINDGVHINAENKADSNQN